jgi:hypothetical protein
MAVVLAARQTHFLPIGQARADEMTDALALLLVVNGTNPDSMTTVGTETEAAGGLRQQYVIGRPLGGGAGEDEDGRDDGREGSRHDVYSAAENRRARRTVRREVYCAVAAGFDQEARSVVGR